MSYKNTLNLPKTEFEMRGNLSKKEPDILDFWNKIKLYEKTQEKNIGNKPFFLHDGPPYANGNIHIGHALNKILKDIVNKSKIMNGYYVDFIPGWDTHGLPIEQKVTDSGVNRKTIPVSEFRMLCENYALKQVEIQKAQMLRLGLIGRFNDPYITLTKEYEAKQIEVFFSMYSKDLIHKGLKPVYWSPSSESALAEAEIEYHNKRSPSIFVKFEVTKGNGKVAVGDNILIWTSTPWTIPANVGVAVGEKIKYTKVNHNGDILVIAIDTIDELSKILEANLQVSDVFTGSEIFGIEYQHPFIKRIGKVVSGHHVTTELGTGLVHMAGSHGEDDFGICKDNDLEILNYIDDRGYFIESAPIANGEFWLDANKTIGEKLAEVNALVKLKFMTHSYPHDWRTKQPVMFKATPQWFGSVKKIQKELMNAIKSVKWIPDWGMNRFEKMIEDREDWCISRQRVWGVPIPVFYGENKEPILDEILNQHIQKLFEEYGSNIWFEKEAKELLPKGYSHPSSPNGQFKKEKDIMDVWFDSGSSFYAVKKLNSINHNISMYLEGSDQYRGWFNSSLITSVAVIGKAPYEEVLTHGFVLDGKGEKMSKSKGNIIDPLDIINQKGADIIRLWTASTKYQVDIRISDKIINQISEYYRSIRFKLRFAMSNLYDFNYKKDATFDFSDYDKYALMLIQKYNKDCVKWYDKYEFGNIISETNIILNKLSTEYFDFIKDIIYITKPNAKERRAIQTVLYTFVDTFLRVLAPILSFTTEEAYKHFVKVDKKESVLLENIKVESVIEFDQKLFEKFEKLMVVKEDIYKEIEELRNTGKIAKSGECEIYVSLKNYYKEIEEFTNLEQFLMVAKIIFNSDNNFDGKELNTAFVKVIKTNGKACNRCRSFKDNIKNDICKSCLDIIGIIRE